MGLFDGKDKEEATTAAVARLSAMPLADLAVELLPRFADDYKLGDFTLGPTVFDIAEHVLDDKPRGPDYPSLIAVLHEGIQRLEHASLVVYVGGSSTTGLDSMRYGLTRRGRAALEQNNVGEHVDRG